MVARKCDLALAVIASGTWHTDSDHEQLAF